jgi:hypothetical protein
MAYVVYRSVHTRHNRGVFDLLSREIQEEADMAKRFFSGLWILLSVPAKPIVGFSPPATASDYVEYKRATG